MRSNSRSGVRRLALLACAVSLACTGCQLRLRVDVDVDRSGGGVLAVAVGADAELLARAQQAGVDPLGELVTTAEALDGGWTVRDDDGDGGGRIVTLSAPFANPDELAALSADVSDALNADEVTLLQPLSITATDDGLRVRGTAAALPRRAVRDFGLTRRAAVRRITRAEAFDYQVRVAMPGEVVSASPTAANVDGRLVWSVPVGEELAFDVVGTRPGPPILRAVAGAITGGAAAAAVLWLVARRRRRVSG